VSVRSSSAHSLSNGKRSNGNSEGFDFTAHMRVVCADMVDQLEELAHIDLDRVAIGFSQARKRVLHGLQATLTPMRFEGGHLTTNRNGRRYTAQRLIDEGGTELLYILSFYLPRFSNLDLQEKLSTIVHELWHISPRFDGDLRRFAGRCYAHGRSQKEFDTMADRLALRWLSLGPPETLVGFLRLNFRQLAAQHGHVFGQKIPTPKLISLAD